MTKIDIISGFLGAGKTTLINKLVSDAYAGDYGVVVAASLISIAIPLIIYLIFQKRILEGIATTGLK